MCKVLLVLAMLPMGLHSRRKRNSFWHLQRNPSLDGKALLNILLASAPATAFKPCGSGAFSSSARICEHARLRSARMSAKTSKPGELLRAIPEPLFSVAPMMDVTDRHFRYLFRKMSRRAVLWTEMVTVNALQHKPELTDRLFGHSPCESPVVLQLGGNDPVALRMAAEMAQPYGFDEVNLNCGCPSEKTCTAGAYGAALMRDAGHVAELMNAIHDGAGGVDASVKCRIGIDDMDSYEWLHNFVGTIAEQGNVNHFIVHARKAILGKRFNPEDNRRVPPLRHDRVLRLIEDFPELRFTLNGGITTYEEVRAALDAGVAGVMVGRAARNRPFYWSRVDELIYGDPPSAEDRCRETILADYCEYAEDFLAGFALDKRSYQKQRRFLCRALEELFSGHKACKRFRSALNDGIRDVDTPFTDVVQNAITGIYKTNPRLMTMQPEDQDLDRLSARVKGSAKDIQEGKTDPSDRHKRDIERMMAESKVILDIVPTHGGSHQGPNDKVRFNSLLVKRLKTPLRTLGLKISRRKAQLIERLKSKKSVRADELQSQPGPKATFKSALVTEVHKKLKALGRKISGKKADQIERLRQREREQKSQETQNISSEAQHVVSADMPDADSSTNAGSEVTVA